MKNQVIKIATLNWDLSVTKLRLKEHRIDDFKEAKERAKSFEGVVCQRLSVNVSFRSD